MLFNSITEWILKSPFHGLISTNTMIVYYTGQKSGKAYHTPIDYRRMGDVLLTISWKNRTWWRNFRASTQVKILLAGHLIDAHMQATEDDATVMEGLNQFIGGNPRAAHIFNIYVGKDGQLDTESLRKAAAKRVVVRTTLK